LFWLEDEWDEVEPTIRLVRPLTFLRARPPRGWLATADLESGLRRDPSKRAAWTRSLPLVFAMNMLIAA